jgi:hypothetical protein
MHGSSGGALFERSLILPDVTAQERFARLLGIDEQKTRLAKMLGIFVNSSGIESWAKKHHPDARQLIERVTRRPPLVVLEGDVGCGKTELAETVGDAVAREERITVTLLPLSLASRGQGRVGEMTQLLSAAFDHLATEAAKVRTSTGKNRGAVILLVDEADALAQSRELSQMHHEDKAGVNALIRGIDRIANERLPAAVIMCTNRLSSLDPAIQRRAADILTFDRPGEAQRRALLAGSLGNAGFGAKHIEALVATTGPTKTRTYGFTYSDLTQRLLPALVLDAYPNQPLDPERAIAVAENVSPTPPFKEVAR